MCSDEDPRANVRVIVKDANLQVVDVIEGYCRKPVDVAMVTFNDEGQVTLLRSDEAWRQATISVSLEHLDPSSWHVPFITIVYLSQAADAVAISQRWATISARQLRAQPSQQEVPQVVPFEQVQHAYGPVSRQVRGPHLQPPHSAQENSKPRELLLPIPVFLFLRGGLGLFEDREVQLPLPELKGDVLRDAPIRAGDAKQVVRRHSVIHPRFNTPVDSTGALADCAAIAVEQTGYQLRRPDSVQERTEGNA
ncbi:ABC transporter [Babesia caballi]|uniref:ABC transporter n=1 Tax=Babesia caballi TaxID=5871 RepID=A0AAV4LS88_BABCB|nr:ABC transporter [Babesia caballi]